MPDEFLDSLAVEKRTSKWRELAEDPDKAVFVVEDDEGYVVGFSIVGSSRDEDAGPSTAEVGAIYVQPEKWKMGFGRALILKSITESRDRGFDEITLWVLEGNERARRFYQSFGFIWDGTVKDVNRPEGFSYRDVRYRLRLRPT